MNAESLFGVSLGLILLPASVSKIASPARFVDLIERYHFVPVPVRAAVSRGFPVVEGIMGILMIINRGYPWVVLAGSGMFLGFAVVGGYELRSATSTNPSSVCGCLGGLGGLKITPGSVVLNVVLGAVGLSILSASWLNFDPPIPGPVGYGLGVLVAACYWLSIYALSVLDTFNEAIQKKGSVG